MGKLKITGKGAKKYARSKKKEAGRNTPISHFVRNKISAEVYFKQTNQA